MMLRAFFRTSQSLVFCSLVLVDVVCCGASRTPRAEPQSAVNPPAEAAAAGVVDLPPVVEDLVQIVPAMADSGFWFVSTEHSPQSFEHTCPRFCPGVLRYEECGGYRHSNMAELCAGLEPGVPVCIMVHGSFVDPASARRESACTWKWLRRGAMGRRMQMIYLTWPSYSALGPLVQLEVNKLGLQAARNGYYLAELTQYIPSECPICLLGHSHGTRVIASALHLLAGGAVQGVCHPFARATGRHIRAVFAASAMDHHWLNPSSRYGRALCSTQCLLNLKNSRDAALRFYPCRIPLFTKRAFGQTGLTSRDRRQSGGMGVKVNDYEVSGIIGPAHLWPYYYNSSYLAVLIHNYVYFSDYTASLSGALN